jgi:exodeoxyribonuclease V
LEQCRDRRIARRRAGDIRVSATVAHKLTVAPNGVTLSESQEHALSEIRAAIRPGRRHLLTGYAGSGKTTLVQHLASDLSSARIVLTAPTHKAVAVLARNLRGLDIQVPCRTIHSLLGLVPKYRGARLIFERPTRAAAVTADIVVIDECSMISEELYSLIEQYLSHVFILFVGDPAQIPPVGERASPTFDTFNHSHLGTIVRQAADNPLLAAADIIRRSQGGPPDWSWIKKAHAKPLGVYIPADPDAALKTAYLSEAYAADPEYCRFLAWTNEAVRTANRKIRFWRYGETETPFVPGERALVRAPAVATDDKTVLLNTNDETTVVSIEAATFKYPIRASSKFRAWTAVIPSWKVVLRRDDGGIVTVDMPRDRVAYEAVLSRLVSEAAQDRQRWKDRRVIMGRTADLQAVYACTIHVAQGSTFRNVFVDVADVRRRGSHNVLEMQQLFYVAVTRASHALLLVNT